VKDEEISATLVDLLLPFLNPKYSKPQVTKYTKPQVTKYLKPEVTKFSKPLITKRTTTLK
jgi:hypothetical protein